MKTGRCSYLVVASAGSVPPDTLTNVGVVQKSADVVAAGYRCRCRLSKLLPNGVRRLWDFGSGKADGDGYPSRRLALS